MLPDEIRLTGLDLPVRIGVPDAERREWQTLQADVHLQLQRRAESMADNIAFTIDYARCANRLKTLAAERPRQLLETLAAEMAACVLDEFGAVGVRIELRKRILPGVDHVAVRIQRP